MKFKIAFFFLLLCTSFNCFASVKKAETDTTLSAYINRIGISEFNERLKADTNIISMSLLCQYIPFFPGGAGNSNPNTFYASNSSILMLFQLAYGVGDWWKFGPGMKPGKTKFITNHLGEFDAPSDSSSGEAYSEWRSKPNRNWNYFVKVPPSDSAKDLKFSIMKSELARTFPFIIVKIEKQDVHVWVLRRLGNNNSFMDNQSNETIQSFLQNFRFIHQQEVIVDETNYSGKIKKITPNDDFKNMDGANTQLNKIGLELIKSIHKQDVLVLTDIRDVNSK